MNQKLTTKQIALIAMGVALITVCSWISIPATVPFTLQTFAVCLVTAVFGLRMGIWAVLCYILLGAVGAPVFSGFKGGFGALLGTTGGYIIGFLFTALIVGTAVKKWGRNMPILILSMALGILLCYTFGTAWFMLVYAKNSGPIGIGTALGWCVIPYLIPDGAKIVLAALLTGRLYPIMKKGNLL
ncbi:MAG: biotin transporter BioY [Oscillospiraceae bacterium]|nr:biotin transporter BioY [Oscillospiraceae bacterium]